MLREVTLRYVKYIRIYRMYIYIIYSHTCLHSQTWTLERTPNMENAPFSQYCVYRVDTTLFDKICVSSRNSALFQKGIDAPWKEYYTVRWVVHFELNIAASCEQHATFSVCAQDSARLEMKCIVWLYSMKIEMAILLRVHLCSPSPLGPPIPPTPKCQNHAPPS